MTCWQFLQPSTKQSYLIITTVLRLLFRYFLLPTNRINSIPSIHHQNRPNQFYFHLKTLSTICYLLYKSLYLLLFLLPLLYLYLLPTNPIAFHYMLITQQSPIIYLLHHSNSIATHHLPTTQRLPTFFNSLDCLWFLRLDRDYKTLFHHPHFFPPLADILLLLTFTDWITFFIQNVRQIFFTYKLDSQMTTCDQITFWIALVWMFKYGTCWKQVERKLSRLTDIFFKQYRCGW